MTRSTSPRRLLTLGLGGLALALTVTTGTAAAAAPDPADPTPTPPVPVATVVTLSAPAKVVDEKSVALDVVWATETGEPVVGGAVTFEQKVKGAWKAAGTRTSAADGTARLAVKPRTDSVWRARGAAGTDGTTAWAADTSSTVSIDNVPPEDPVKLAGPAPTKLPAQARASGAGANVVITQVPNAVWRNMVGRSWHRGCPVGRSSLRLLRVNYWGFDGYRHRGELVLASSVVRRAGAAMSDMYAARLPLRTLYRVDRFGWSRRVQGADDHASMAADNTSAFNCRWVVNRPGVRSPHSSGRAIDMNPWENPYHSATGWVPNRYWADRSHPRVAWRAADHPVVRIWRAHGFRWTYGTSDSQHWDGRSAAYPSGTFVG